MLHKKEQVQKPLSPDMRSELDVLRPVPPPDSEAWQAGRTAFLAQVRTLSPQSSPDRPVAAKPLPRRREWRGISFLRRAPLAVIEVILACGLLVSGAMGAAYVSQESLPGAPLYPLKLQLEDWQYAWLDDPGEQATFAMDRAQERVEELVILVVRGKTVPAQVITRYQAQLDLAWDATEALDESPRAVARAQIAEQLSAQKLAMKRMQVLLEPGVDDSVEAMLSVIERAQAEAGAPEDDPAFPYSDHPLPVLTPLAYLTATPTPTLAATSAPRTNAPLAPLATATRIPPSLTALPTPTPTATRIFPTPTATSTPLTPPSATPAPTAVTAPEPTSTTTPTSTSAPTPTSTPTEAFTPTSAPTPTSTPIEAFTPTSAPTPTLAPNDLTPTSAPTSGGM